MVESSEEIRPHEETIKYLKIIPFRRNTLYKMAKKSKIPTVKIKIGKRRYLGIGAVKNDRNLRSCKEDKLDKHKKLLIQLLRRNKHDFIWRHVYTQHCVYTPSWKDIRITDINELYTIGFQQ